MKKVALTGTKGSSVADAEGDLRPLALRAMFWRPNYLGISAWLEHIPFAFWLVEAHQPRVIVELGTHYGVSYFSFCQAVDRLGLDTRCYAVDSWKGDEHSGLYGEEVFETVRRHNEAHYSGFSRLIRSTFDDALDYFTDGTVDLLHIDGLHTFEAVRHDFESWLPKLSPRAVVVLHDTNVRERHFGVFKFFETLRAEYPNFEFVHGHGLGVVGVGPMQTDHMARLFASDRDRSSRQALHEVFGRLGHACAEMQGSREMRVQAENLHQQLAASHTDVRLAKEELGRKQHEAEALTRQLAEERARLRTATDSDLRSRAALDERLRANNELVEELRAQLTQARSEAAMSAKHAAAESEQTVRLSFERNLTAKRLAELEALKAESATLLQSLKAREADLAAARKEIAANLRERDDLLRENEALRAEIQTILPRLQELEPTKILAEGSARALAAKDEELASFKAASVVAEAEMLKILNAKEAELAAAGTELATTLAELSALKGREQELEANVATRFQELAVLTRSLSEASLESDEKGQTISQLNHDLAATNKQIAAAALEHSQLRTSVADRFREIAVLSRAVADHENELRRRVAQVEGLQARLSDMTERWTWRLNAGSRGLYDMLGGTAARRRRLVGSSMFFDADWYISQNPDVSQSRFNPLDHFLRYGGREGRDPSPLFSVRKYFQLYPEVYSAGYNALVHYLEFGRLEGREAPQP